MGAQAIYVLWLRDMKWFLRAKARIISMFAMPFFWLAIIGMGLNAVIPTIPGAGSYLDFMAPGIIGMMILFSATMAGVSVLWDKQFGFMKEILVAPVSRVHIMLGKTLGGATTSIIQGVILLFVAGLIGARLPNALGFLQALVFMALISLAFVSMGLAFASKIEDPIAFPIVINFIIMPLFFLSGAIFPIGMAPGWLRTLAYLDPFTYGVDGLRASILGASEFPIWVDFGVLVVFLAVMVLLGGYFFRKMSI